MNFIRHYNKTILLTAVIIILSLYKFNSTQRVEQIFPHADKAVHVLMYFGIMITLLFERYLRNRRMDKKGGVIFLYPLVLGASLEIIQSRFTVYRSGDWFDLIADIAGILLAIVVFLPVKDVTFFKRIVKFPF